MSVPSSPKRRTTSSLRPVPSIQASRPAPPPPSGRAPKATPTATPKPESSPESSSGPLTYSLHELNTRNMRIAQASMVHVQERLRIQQAEAESTKASGKRPMRPLPRPTHERRQAGQESEMSDAELAKKWRATLKETMKLAGTIIISETLDFEALTVHDPDGTAFRPDIVLKAVSSSKDHHYHLWVAAKKTVESSGFDNIEHKLKQFLASDGRENSLRMWKYWEQFVSFAFHRLLVELGCAVMDRVAGLHFTYTDPRYDGDSAAIVSAAKTLVWLFEYSGVDRRKVVINIPATETGVVAAKELESCWNIHTNLILVSGLLHAAACAEARNSMISVDVGSVLEWYEHASTTVASPPINGDLTKHPGIINIQSLLRYFKLHAIKTKIVGTGFRDVSEICLLAVEFDAVCLSAPLMESLRNFRLPLCISAPESSPATIRAREAQYPTSLLHEKAGFLAALPAETRSMVGGSLYYELSKMRKQVEQIKALLSDEMEYQARLKNYALNQLLWTLRVGKEKAKASEDTAHDSNAGEPLSADSEHIDPKAVERRTVPRSSTPSSASDTEVIEMILSTLVEGDDYF